MRLFEGIRVLEIGGGIAADYATRLFADYGAEVIKIEPPTGDPVRRMVPFIGNVPDENGSAVFLHTNTSKKSVVLDLKDQSARDALLKLAATADVVVESLKPGALAAMGLGFDDLVKVQPKLVLTSITPFGQDGPYAQYEGSELIYYGMGGPMAGNGSEDEVPVKLGGYMSIYQTGNTAATATMAAVLVAEGQGEPVHIDISGFETGLSSSDRRTTFLLAHAYNGEVTPRGNVLGGILPNGAFPAEDGYVQTVVTQAWLPRMMSALADDDLNAYFAKVAQNPAMFATMETKEAIDAALYTLAAHADEAAGHGGCPAAQVAAHRDQDTDGSTRRLPLPRRRGVLHRGHAPGGHRRPSRRPTLKSRAAGNPARPRGSVSTPKPYCPPCPLTRCNRQSYYEGVSWLIFLSRVSASST